MKCLVKFLSIYGHKSVCVPSVITDKENLFAIHSSVFKQWYKNMYFEIDRLLIRKFINVRQSSNKNMLTSFEEFDFPVVIKYHFNSGV